MAPMTARIRLLGAPILVAFMGIAATACSSASPASTSAPPEATGASPSAGGDQVVAAAATAYAAAANTAKVANAALAAQYSGTLTLALGRAYYRAAADIDGTFLASVRAITFPPAAAADAAALINRVTADEALDVQGSTAVTAAGMALVKSARPADLAAVAAAGDRIRADLGLPAAP